MRNDMNEKFDAMSENMNSLSESVSSLQAKVQDLTDEVKELRDDNEDLREENTELKKTLQQMEHKVDDLENRSRRNNIIVHGLPSVTSVGDKQETWEQCEQALQNMFQEKLGINEEMILDRAHRLRPGDSKSPIVARFAFSKDKERVMRAKLKLKGTDIFVGDDFSKNVRDIRKKLSPFLKKAKEEKKLCKMVFDHLVMEGKRYVYDPNTADIVLAQTST
nr:hypothetical protein BaRGS_011090 [Batillaria attramentaria]KAG5689412.1 hypothetical protein BaRGS_017930 [Batillaria attramentaria]